MRGGKILLVLIIVAIDFLTSNIFLYTASRLYCYFSSLTKRFIEMGYMDQSMEVPSTNLIILSHSRSGSSFLGQIFNHHPNVFYMYEPLFIMKSTTLDQSSFYESSSLQLLIDILNCNFENQEEYVSFLSQLPLQRYSSRALTVPFCTQNQTDVKNGKNTPRYVCKPLEPSDTSKVCSAHKHRVIKLLTHRILNFKVNFFKPLMKSELNVKILHLVRDPRAIVASMERVGWIQSYTQFNPKKTHLKTPYQHFEHRVKSFCLSLLDTIKFILEAERKLLGRYKLVRYEDLVQQITTKTDDVMRFAQFRSTDDVTRWVQKSTHAKNIAKREQNYDYSTERANILHLTDSWRRTLSRKQIIVVEKYCRPVMTVLQYPAVFTDHA